ncbi:hypothetical protein [Halalkalicoccus paucihalophilus]|uniref:hypothetical protein n=1 Tax=Halalkalicoccus paucihalophilus TaxID=1008153 RepID=UPI00083561F7|nr:hypothetical protein [Halalkalicoccus paucihalophilus]
MSDENVVEEDVESVRLRCRNCGGKAGWLPLSLASSFGVSEEFLRKAAEPGVGEWTLHIDADIADKFRGSMMDIDPDRYQEE